MDIRFRLLNPACRPARGTVSAVGFDVRANLEAPIPLPTGGRVVVPVGIILEIPEGWECQVRPRSGMAAKWGITVLNTPGTIDPDFRGEVGVILVNHGDTNVIVTPGERVAQLVFKRVPKVELVETDALSDTERGANGFGSTGSA